MSNAIQKQSVPEYEDCLGESFTVELAARNPSAYVLCDMDRVLSRENVESIKRACESHLQHFTDEKIAAYNRFIDRAEDEGVEALSKPEEKKSAGGGFVYVMQNRRNGHTKIGFSKEPKYRESTLQSQEPEVELLKSRPGTQKDERALHCLFAHRRLRGEWFDLAPEEMVSLLAGFQDA